MARELSKKRKGFVKDFIDSGNGTRAVLKNYNIKAKDPEKSASVIASNLLGNISVREAIESHAQPAESMIFKLSQKAKGELVRLNASRDILDRAGFKPVEKSESKTLNVDIKVQDKSGLESLREEYEEKLRKKLSNEIK